MSKPVTLVDFLERRFAEDEAAVLRMECACVDGEPQPPDCPERVLRDVEAKRALLDMWQLAPPAADEWLTPALLLIAEPYNDHADWWDEWDQQ